MSRVLNKETVNSDCPHCKKHITTAWVCKLEADGIIRYIYFCPNCQKPLHISNKKDSTLTSASNTNTFVV